MIVKKISAKRGCGYRKPGGLYLCAEAAAANCGMLPFPLTVCDICGQGIKQTRGFTWINSDLFITGRCFSDIADCYNCPMQLRNERMGLMWVGEKFYRTTDAFNREANTRGISKRIAQIPRELELGKTWVALAHPRAIRKIDATDHMEYTAGVFRVFRPQTVEYIMIGTETQEQLTALEKRGITLISETADIDAQTEMGFPTANELP